MIEPHAGPSPGGRHAPRLAYNYSPLLAAGSYLLFIGLGYLLAATSPADGNSRSGSGSHTAAFRDERHSRPSGCPDNNNNRGGGGAGTGPHGSSACRLEFVRYEPADIEAEWVPVAATIKPETPVCELMMEGDDRWLPRLQRWISIGTELDTNRAGPANGSLIAAQAAALAGASAYLSRIVYRNSCTGAALTSHLAPLAGMMRDPRPICGSSEVPGNAQWKVKGPTPHKRLRDHQTKESIILDPTYLAQVREMLAEPAPGVRSSRRALLFDAGAAGFSQGDYSSTRWFLERYAAAGINFDHIYAWEYQPRPGYEFYTGMSPDIIGRFSFYNFGVSAELNATTNPIEIIKRVARPGDFVVYKLDIDTPHIERPLMEQLAADAQAQALISEFFHEHLYVIRDMEPYWRGTMSGSMAESLEMFAALRRGGIRAHVWPYYVNLSIERLGVNAGGDCNHETMRAMRPAAQRQLQGPLPAALRIAD